jgi:hypothetical protein
VSARSVFAKSILTLKLRRNNVKLCLQNMHRTTQGVHRQKHTQYHIFQEEQLSRVRTIARSAQSPTKRS